VLDVGQTVEYMLARPHEDDLLAGRERDAQLGVATSTPLRTAVLFSEGDAHIGAANVLEVHLSELRSASCELQLLSIKRHFGLQPPTRDLGTSRLQLRCD
jgi:hypothetical protein